jgi:hypothetical protein
VLQYLEAQGIPTRILDSNEGHATLNLSAGDTERRHGFHFPWDACRGGAYEWRIHLNPDVASDVVARTNGGNIKIDLAGMTVTRVSAESGGGNMAVRLPDNLVNLSACARSGGGNVGVEVGGTVKGINVIEAGSRSGNVAVSLPAGIAARVHAGTKLGKVTVDPRFGHIEKGVYQSPDYDVAADRIEITAHSGAGNVRVNVR